MPSIDEIKRRNAKAGKFWFSPDTMRFFSSIVYDETFDLVDGGALFVTSERFSLEQKRQFTVRRFLPLTAGIDTVGDMMAFATKQEANRMAKALATAWEGDT